MLWSESRLPVWHYLPAGTFRWSSFLLLDRFGNRLTEVAPYDEELVEELLVGLS